MPVKIRLQRHGKKGRPFYHIVAADARSKRDGKFIEKLGTYNPNVNPAEINLNLDRAFHWLQVGAQPTDTAKAILSYKGAIYKNHLAKGVAKGAFSQEEADKRFDAWMAEKEAKVQAKIDGLKSADDQAKAKILAREKEINEARAAAITAAQSPLVETPAEGAAEAVAEAGDAAEEATDAVAEVVEEAPAAVEEVKEEVAEVVEEAKAEATEVVEEAKAEAAEVVEEAKEEVAEAAEEAKEEVADNKEEKAAEESGEEDKEA